MTLALDALRTVRITENILRRVTNRIGLGLLITVFTPLYVSANEDLNDFDQCFENWDGYLRSARPCVDRALDVQEIRMLDQGVGQDRLHEINTYWRSVCSRKHPERHEIARLSWLQCFFEGRSTLTTDKDKLVGDDAALNGN